MSLTLGLGALVLHRPGRRTGWGWGCCTVVRMSTVRQAFWRTTEGQPFISWVPSHHTPSGGLRCVAVFKLHPLSSPGWDVVVAKHMHRPWGQFLVLPANQPVNQQNIQINTKESKGDSFWPSSLFCFLLLLLDDILQLLI